MTAKRFENVIILDSRAAAILWQCANLDEIRIRARGRNEELYAVLVEVYQAALTWRTSREGIQPRKVTESEERSNWTTPEVIAQHLGITSRTVRNDISRNSLPAVKQGRFWVIDKVDAKTYIAARAA